MLNRWYGFLFGAATYLGVCGGLCALAFLGEFAVPISFDTTVGTPFLHALTADFLVQPKDSGSVKE